ncbi:MAG TPA: ABC transporter ATP-binding protein [Stellaceae bacterium]|nr:ABC transporter ATP-binding protein [Stellaceae bacterium]
MSASLALRGLTKRFGGVVATDDVTLDFEPGSLSAIIGPNGAGKTTLFNLITGRLAPNRGEILLDGENIAGFPETAIVRRGIGRAFQIASLFPQFTVEQALVSAVLAHRRQTHIVARRFPLPEARARAHEVMTLLGLDADADRLSQHLSHGDQKLLDIALALALEPSVLLLDEPTAGMGREERWQMIEKVHRLWTEQKMTLIFIEHDMDIVFQVAQSVRVLHYGGVLAQGTPNEIRGNPAVIEAYLGTSHFGDAG